MPTPSAQPAHRGYAVNVKDQSTYWADCEPLTDEDVQAIYDRRAEDFWDLVQDVGRAHGFDAVYSEGRMGGWAVPQPQPHVDDMWPHEVEAFVAKEFRPFEAEVLALMEACLNEFRDDVARARDKARREPTEAAYWAARDTVTLP